jgi:hypothetical protein
VAGSCERGNELCGSTEFETFYYKRNCSILKTNCAALKFGRRAKKLWMEVEENKVKYDEPMLPEILDL